MRASGAAVAVLVLLLAGAVAILFAPALDARLLDAQFALNRYRAPQALTTDVVVVGIDDAFVDGVEEPLALSHHHLAALLRSVGAAGAAVIGLDIVLPDKRFDRLYSASHPGTDYHRSLLAGLLVARQNSKLVAAKVWDRERRRYFVPQLDFVAVLGEAAMASALVCADADLKVRRYPDAACQPDGSSHTFAGEVVAAMGKRQAWSGLINYQIGTPIRYLPMQDVLAMDSATARRTFAGRGVLVGSVQADVDLVHVPVALAAWLPRVRHVPGVLVHAQAMRSMLNQGLIAVLPLPLVVAGAALACLFWLRPGIVGKLALLVGASLAVLWVSNLFLLQGVWIAPSAMLLTGWTTALGRSAWQAWQHFRDKQRLSRTFSGYVSPGVLAQILSGAIDARDAGSKLPVCVLFSDIRGFTAMSERMPAEHVVTLLNRYFSRMAAVVHRHGGTVDKFIGDGMMAFFGAPNRLERPEQAAMSAAHDMLDELAVLSGELNEEGGPGLRIGIGIHTGPAIIGHIGSAERHEYTAIGDTVNIAARLEGLCATLGYQIICSGDVAGKVGESALLPLGEYPLKGHTAVAVFGGGAR